MPARKGAKRGRAAAAAAVAEVTEPSAVTEEATTEGEEHTAAPSAELQPVALLLTTLLSGEDPSVLPTAIRSLREFFVEKLLAQELPLAKTAAAANPTVAWLRSRYVAYRGHLLALLGREAHALVHSSALHALMECARSEQQGTFSNELYRDLLAASVSGGHLTPDLLGVLAGGYLPYADVRYYTYAAVTRIAQDAKRAQRATAGAAAETAAAEDDITRNLYDVMANTPLKFGSLELNATAVAAKDTGEAAWCLVDGADVAAGGGKRSRALALGGRGDAASPRWLDVLHQKREFSKAWMALLARRLPDDIYRKVLSRLHEAVIPHLPTPVLLADFLTKSIDKGGLVGILALNGIFILVQHHGLEYPQFYDRLYSLLLASAFRAKHRKRFFDLMDLFLKSPLLPAYVAAAFIKRFARLALSAPPSGAVVAITFIHNLLRRHPSCNVLVHRNGDTELPPAAAVGDAAAAAAALDPYLPDMVKPAESNAIKSSLWELHALKNHLYPQVAKFCEVLNKELTQRKKTADLPVSDTTGMSYASVLEEELGRNMKRAPLAFYAAVPTTLLEPAALAPSFPGWDLSTGQA